MTAYELLGNIVSFSDNLPEWLFPGLVLLLLSLLASLVWKNRKLTIRLRIQSEELKDSEESYRYLVDNAHDGIAVVQNKRLVYANQRMCEMTGYDESALFALDTFLPLIAPSARETMLENHLRRLEGKAPPSRYESLFLKRDGTIYPIEITGVLINWRNKPATLNVVTDISDRKAAEEAVQFLAHNDSLTKLPNRYLFRQRLEYSVAQARRSGKPLAVIFIDLNGFKQVNDTYGHDVGDQLLMEVADRLNKKVRDSDTLARIGGDEFVILMPCIERLDSVKSLIKRIDTVFQADFQIEQLMLTSSASFGYAFYPDDGETPDELLKMADQKMYSNKRAQCGY